MKASLSFGKRKMVKRSDRHKKRIGRSSGFVLHFRGAGVDQEKMDKIILDYLRKKADLLGEDTSSADFNAQMAIEVIARGDYQPDRTQNLEGTSAYVREKLKYMKDLGFIRDDGCLTQALRDYARISQTNDYAARLKLLQQRIGCWKLPCPQGVGPEWTPRQNGYRHYRIRPGIMFLYAVKSAEDHGVEIDTDDLTLTALRFFTPAQHGRVDEEFLKNHIDRYFISKAESLPDYKAEFESQMDRVERDLGENLRANNPCAFAMKCRNATNNAYCLIILMRKVDLIEADNRNSAIGHWSGTQQAYDNTGKVPEFNVVRLKDTGRSLLLESIDLLPIWYEDICALISSRAEEDRKRMADFVEKLALGENIPQSDISEQELEYLARLGLSGRFENEVFIPNRRPIFELQYDMP
jgi:hypothetical protein